MLWPYSWALDGVSRLTSKPWCTRSIIVPTCVGLMFLCSAEQCVTPNSHTRNQLIPVRVMCEHRSLQLQCCAMCGGAAYRWWSPPSDPMDESESWPSADGVPAAGDCASARWRVLSLHDTVVPVVHIKVYGCTQRSHTSIRMACIG